MRRELGTLRPIRHTVGVDLGQAQDPTAIVVVETETAQRVWLEPTWPEPRKEVVGVEHRVRHAERLPLQMRYPDQVAYVRGLMRSPQLRADAELVIDMTGCGRPVFDMFLQDGLRPIGVLITAGFDESRDGRVHRVPKLQLVSRLQAAPHAGELKLSPDLAEAEAFKQEFAEFRMRFSDGGRPTFGAREGRHDDLVLALTIALWRAEARARGPRARRVPLVFGAAAPA